MAVAGGAGEARGHIASNNQTIDRDVSAPNVEKAPALRPRGESDLAWMLPFFLVLAGALVFFFWQVSINTNPLA